MASMRLYIDNFQSTPLVLPCFDLDFEALYSHSSDSGYSLHSHHKPTLSEPYWSIVFQGKASFTTTGDDPERYDLLDNLPAAFLPAFQWQHAPQEQRLLQPKAGTYSVISSKPSDWDSICTKYIATRSTTGYDIIYSSYTDWDQLNTYCAQNGREILRFNYPIAEIFLVKGGLYDMSFGIYNGFNYQVTGFGINRLFSGIGSSISQSSINNGIGIATGYSRFNFKKIGGTDLINFDTCADSVPATTSDPSVIYVQSYPVAFTVNKNMVIGGDTVTADTLFIGVMSVTFTQYGTPNRFIIQALDKKCWDLRSAAGNSAGSDTQPTGGHGKQQKGGYNPQKSIKKNTNGGLLTNPTTAAGFVIYQFTPAEFTQFLSKVYSETALPGVGSAIGGIASEIGAADSIYQAIASYFNKGWSNTENIVFVKTSPVNFPTSIYNLSKLSIGALGIGSISARVVQSYIVDGTEDLGSIGSDPEWFTDVEPYASASIFFPLAGSVAVPPSVLAGSSCSLRYAFNLLNNGCGYSMHILKGGNYLHLAKNGECAKSADCVIPGRDISGTVSQLGALAATGIATLATGGTAAPSLVTTALGAATTAVHEATDLSISNMPPCSSGSPYDDTVNGGLRDVVLYRTKAERYTSGEGTTNYRSGIIGTFSYQYISGLDQLAAGSFVSVLDLKLPEAAGMTKAEHDRICALLSEGAWI